MARKIEQVHFPEVLPKKKRVAAYARVSTGKDAMLHSLSAQVSYYSKMIQSHNDWEYAGVYTDEALSGTKDNRENFQRLLADCRSGKVDMIITKSISRFARNTITLLETVRELKSLGVDVYFEEQSIHTASADGELMLTILASYAQEESLSASENQKWKVRKQFQEGKIMNVRRMFGYRVVKGNLEVDEATAPIVREIFRRAADGESFGAIARDLNNRCIRGTNGGKWKASRIAALLGNEKYCGNALLQKKYRNNHLEKKELRNTGELPMYYAEGTHEGIIDEELFCAVREILQRNTHRISEHTPCERSIFSGMIVCESCGRHYKRITSNGRKAWNCALYQEKGKEMCTSKQIPEEELFRLASEVLGVTELTPNAFFDRITAITATKENALIFHLAGGETPVKRWKPRSRSDVWTGEMREAARQRASERRTQNG